MGITAILFALIFKIMEKEICSNCGHHLSDHFKYSCEGMNGCFCSSSDYREKTQEQTEEEGKKEEET